MDLLTFNFQVSFINGSDSLTVLWPYIETACPLFPPLPHNFFPLPMLQWLMTYKNSTLFCSAYKTTPLRNTRDNGYRNAVCVPDLL